MVKLNLIAILILVAVICAAYARAGKCAYCYPYACFDSSVCGSGCYCAKVGGGLQGLCAEVN